MITKGSLYNYVDDNTIAVIGSSKKEVTDCLTKESESAIKWFRDNMIGKNPTKFQAIVLRDTDSESYSG